MSPLEINGALFHKIIAKSIKSTKARMLKRLLLHISPYILFLDFLLQSLSASSQTPRCPETDVFLEWSGSKGVWARKCSSEFPSSTSPSNPPGPVCQTPACLRFSKRVLAAMDPEMEPCQDFHKFACGKFKGDGSFAELNNLFKNKMIEILKEPPKQTQDMWEQHMRCVIKAKTYCQITGYILKVEEKLKKILLVAPITPPSLNSSRIM